MKEKYEVNIECNNCNYIGTVSIPKGEVVPSTIKCPNCECETAHKLHNLPFINYPKPPKKFIIHSPENWLWTHETKTEKQMPYIDCMCMSNF
jgi:hypothetical protein